MTDVRANGHTQHGDVPPPEPAPFEVVTVPRDTSFEHPLDETAPKPEPVHEGDGIPIPDLGGERLPIMPAHLRTWAGISGTAWMYLDAARFHVLFHLLRSPKYAALAVWWAVIGLGRLANAQRRWWWVSESAPLRSKAVVDGNSPEWRALHGKTAKTRSWRGAVLGAELFAVLLVLALIAWLAPWWVQVTLTVLAVPPLARYGRPAHLPIVQSAVTTPLVRRINSDVVIRAYTVAGLCNPDKPGQALTFGSPMSRDGEGSRVVVYLPYGKGLDDAVKARPQIASGLDVSVSQVYFSRDDSSHRRHVLWVADRDPLSIPAGRTPLLTCKATDIWKPAPLGPDERGRLVSLLLMWASILVGALPRQGKSFTARLLGLYAALDPYVRLDVFDCSGKPDWRKFALVADSCAFGLTPTKAGIPAEIFLATLERIKRDVEDRYNRLSAMPTSICPQGKLTRRIARDPDYGMPVRGLILDEFQEWFGLGDISKEIAKLLVYVSKVAPAAGVFLVDATQKPSGIGGGGDLGTQFTAFRDNHQVRFSLRTPSYTVSEMVLGQGAYGEGLDSSTLLPQYKGVGILRGATDESPTVRNHLADHEDAEKILVAARALRERAGTLSGMALGEDMTPAESDIIADVLAVLGTDNGLWWETAAERLARRFPDRHADATGEGGRSACGARGVPSVDVRETPGSLSPKRKGCRRDHLDSASRP